ncbi:MAG: (2Fe-2S)-binding protein [Burkholderiales bacterium]|jgi:carbon-monoxide dehydrogenase small subunit|nr:(2Fe-2S)-binding protein [Burkholderiales bacterium]
MTRINLNVNGQAVSHEVENRTLLIELLREGLGLTGSHVGCDSSQCGCCTVLVDSQTVKACTMLAVQANGSKVSTIESMGTPGNLHPIQQAFVECHGLQCGYCTPGMIMSTAALLAEHPDPTDAQIEHALEGNLCRCTGYVNIVASVRQAAAEINKTR